MNLVQPPYQLFADADGTPLENGQIYIGSATFNPRANPITVYLDEARTIAATQPIRTLGGRPSYQGSPTNLYISPNAYSIEVLDRKGVTVVGPTDAPSLLNDVLPSITTQTGTSYTLDADDAGTVIVLTNASAITLTVPPDSSASIAVGTAIEIQQGGAGQVTFAAGSGVTLNVRGSFTQTSGQYAVAGLRKMAANTWVLTGDIL